MDPSVSPVQPIIKIWDEKIKYWESMYQFLEPFIKNVYGYKTCTYWPLIHSSKCDSFYKFNKEHGIISIRLFVE